MTQPAKPRRIHPELIVCRFMAWCIIGAMAMAVSVGML